MTMNLQRIVGQTLFGEYTFEIMTYQDWLGVPNFPRQRPTEKHAKKAKKAHLRYPYSWHYFVHAAIHPKTGEMHKVDSHTRTLLWEQGHLPAPSMVFVLVYKPADPDEDAAEDLFNLYYKSFDNHKTTKTVDQDLWGILNELGLIDDFVSKKLIDPRITGALAGAWGWGWGNFRKNDVQAPGLIKRWTTELVLVDRCNPPSRATHAVLAAMMLGFRRYGPKLVEFWNKVFADAGVKKADGSRDAIEIASRLIDSITGKKLRINKNKDELLERLLSCQSNWHRKREYKGKSAKRTSIDRFRRLMPDETPTAYIEQLEDLLDAE